MSIFDRIKNAIWKHDQPAASRPSGPSPAPSAGARPSPTSSRAGTTRGATVSPSKPVDIEAVLEARSKAAGQKLNWRTSIVDLMKLVDLDPSLANRKELAKELGYTGSTDDSAAMNVWLHKQVMRKLADSGGIVPAALRD